jgi:hypothetical protein
VFDVVSLFSVLGAVQNNGYGSEMMRMFEPYRCLTVQVRNRPLPIVLDFYLPFRFPLTEESRRLIFKKFRH